MDNIERPFAKSHRLMRETDNWSSQFVTIPDRMIRVNEGMQSVLNGSQRDRSAVLVDYAMTNLAPQNARHFLNGVLSGIEIVDAYRKSGKDQVRLGRVLRSAIPRVDTNKENLDLNQADEALAKSIAILVTAEMLGERLASHVILATADQMKLPTNDLYRHYSASPFLTGLDRRLKKVTPKVGIRSPKQGSATSSVFVELITGRLSLAPSSLV